MLEIIDELFSVPILSVKLNLDASEIEKHCKELYKNNDNRIVSNQGGFQTLIDKNDKAMKPLVKKIELHGQLLAQQSPPISCPKTRWIQNNRSTKNRRIIFNKHSLPVEFRIK